MSWRNEARAALRAYPKILKKKAETPIRITSSYDGVIVRHDANRTVENAVMNSSLSEREENIITAVSFALEMQSRYHNAAERRKFVELVYFRGTHTMHGAALECKYSVDTIWRWNTEILTAVYVGLKK